MSIVINYFAPWPTIYHRLLALPTWSLLTFVGHDGYRSKLYSLKCTPGLLIALNNFHPIEADSVNCGLELMLVGALDGQPCLDPTAFTFSVVSHPGVTHRRQFTGGVI